MIHSGDPVLYLGNPKGVDREGQGRVIGAVNALNREIESLEKNNRQLKVGEQSAASSAV